MGEASEPAAGAAALPPRLRRQILTAAGVVVAVIGVGVALLASASDDGGGGAAARSTTTSLPDLAGSERSQSMPTVPLRADQDEALRLLSGLPAPPTPFDGEESHGHDEHVVPTVALPADVQARLDAQLEQARTAVRRYPRAKDAMADGYALGSGFSPGIGTHFVKWSLVDQPFDPARPAMLLYDGMEADAELVGLSYWVRSDGVAPDGFAGPNDFWHRHFGLCIRDGLASGENIPVASECDRGVYLDGRNLWMLHAWVVPGHEDAQGVFAPTNAAIT